MDEFSFVSWEWCIWMAFTTLIFWSIPPQFRFKSLIIATAFFLIVTDISSFTLLSVMTFITYASSSKNNINSLKSILTVLLIIIILIYYKWMKAYFADIRELGFDIVIPIGLSYYSLRCIHYIIERYKGTIIQYDLKNLIAYLFFLPTIWIGPIHRYDDYIRDQRRHRWDAKLFSIGLEKIIYGYVKVVILGNLILNTLYPPWAIEFAGGGTQLAQYLELVRTGLEMYLIFSGYSDIAIGFGNLLGFKIMENFKRPYFKKNISDFWQSWHISLTSWCKQYIYTSVIAKTRSPALGVIATLIIIGLWHELSYRYILWGLYHGTGIVIWQYFQRVRTILPSVKSKSLRKLLDLLSILITVHFVWLGFLLVKEHSLDTMIDTLKILILGTT